MKWKSSKKIPNTHYVIDCLCHTNRTRQIAKPAYFCAQKKVLPTNDDLTWYPISDIEEGKQICRRWVIPGNKIINRKGHNFRLPLVTEIPKVLLITTPLEHKENPLVILNNNRTNNMFPFRLWHWRKWYYLLTY